MTLYLEAKTTIPDLFIDYIEVRLASGESASLNWDESEIYRNPNGFGAKYPNRKSSTMIMTCPSTNTRRRFMKQSSIRPQWNL